MPHVAGYTFNLVVGGQVQAVFSLQSGRVTSVATAGGTFAVETLRAANADVLRWANDLREMDQRLEDAIARAQLADLVPLKDEFRDDGTTVKLRSKAPAGWRRKPPTRVRPS